MHQINMEVRDYECDIQGVVNNASYLNYFEHARHLMLKEKALSFSALHLQGINPAMYSSKIKYLYPLHPDDKFFITSVVTHEKMKIVFEQNIFLIENNKLCCQGIFEVVLLDKEWHLLKDRIKTEWLYTQLKS